MPRTKAQPSRRALKPKAEYHDYYSLVFRAYGDSDKVSRKDDSKLKEFDQVCKSDDLFGVFQAGVVMVDVDDGNNANVIQRMLDDSGVSYLYQQTTRGLHFFFYHGKWSKVLRDRSHITSAVGLEVDYKCYSVDGTKLSKTLDDGTVQPRPLLTSPNWTGDLVDLPHFLVPVHATEDFTKLTDCRNETFYIYILSLLRFGLNKEQVKHTISLINNYVLPNSLSERELNTVLRDETFPSNNEIFIYRQGTDKTPKLDYELFAKHLIDKYIIIKCEGVCYVYRNGLYKLITEDESNSIIMDELKNTTEKTRVEIMKYIKNFSEEKCECSSRYTLFNNCIYDFKNKQVLPINKDYVFFNRIPHDYIETSLSVEIVDQYFKTLSCHDSEVEKLLIELIGYCLIRNNSLDKFFITYGEGGCGKSDYFEIITKLLGRENVSFRDLEDLQDAKGTGALKDKLLNIGDDIDPTFIEKCSNLKKLSTGQYVKGKVLYKDEFDFKYIGKMLYSTNKMPRFNDTTSGLNRRMVIIPFKAKFKHDDYTDSKDRIYNIVEKMTTNESIQYLLSLAVKAAQKLYDTKTFTLSKNIIEVTDQIKRDNNPILVFLEEYGDLSGKYTDDVYMAYSVWCQESGFKPLNKIAFGKMITGYNTKVKRLSPSERKFRRKDTLRIYIRNTPLEEVANR